jgi:hypothetical protein
VSYAVEVPSGGMMYIPSVMTIGEGVQLILRLMSKHQNLLCWYYWWEGFMKNAFQMALDGIILSRI